MGYSMRYSLLVTACFLLVGCLYPPPLPEEIKGEVQATYQKYEKKISRLETEKSRLEKELAALQERIVQLQKELNKAQQKAIELQVRHQELERLLTMIPSRKTITPTPSALIAKVIQGRISAINKESNLFILSVGQDNQVQSGMECRVYQNHQLIGKIVIHTVEKDWSIGHRIQEEEGKEFRVGDKIVIKIE